MKTVQFRYVWLNDKFTLNGIEWKKTNFGRGMIFIGGKKEFINVKKNKLVEVNG